MLELTTDIRLGNTLFSIVATEKMHQKHSEYAHIHTTLELFYIVEGVFYVTIEESDVKEIYYPIKAGQAVLIAPNQYHQTSTKEYAKKYGLYISFSQIKSSDCEDTFTFFSKAFSDFKLRTIDSATKIGASIFELSELCIKEPVCKFERIQAECIKLILAIYDYIVISQSEALKIQNQEKRDSIHNKINALMANVCENDFSLEYLAKNLFMSQKKVAAYITELYGKSFHKVKTDMRMNIAKQFLRKSDESISEISQRVGYDSVRGFLLAFYKYTGCTPSEYRKEERSIEFNENT